MKSIYIIEDNDNFRNNLKNWLPHFDIVGEEIDERLAVEHVKRIKPDLLILDLSLPELYGLAAMKTLRKSMFGMKILVLSGHESDYVFREAFSAGADAYCSKEETGNTIRMTVEHLLAE